MNKADQPRSSQQTLTFDAGRVGRLTDQERSEVVAAVAELLRGALGPREEVEAANEGD